MRAVLPCRAQTPFSTILTTLAFVKNKMRLHLVVFLHARHPTGSRALLVLEEPTVRNALTVML